MMILVQHSDPRMGETVFRLAGITLEEPAADLFQVPSGYSVVEAPRPPRPPAPPK